MAVASREFKAPTNLPAFAFLLFAGYLSRECLLFVSRIPVKIDEIQLLRFYGRGITRALTSLDGVGNRGVS